MRTRRVLVLGIIALSFQALAHAQNLRPGSYEVTVELGLPGVPMKAPPKKEVTCVTPEDLKDLAKLLTRRDGTEDCKASDYKSSGNTVTFTTICGTGSARSTMSAELTFSGDAYVGVMTMNRDSGRARTIKTTGRRIGDCVK